MRTARKLTFLIMMAGTIFSSLSCDGIYDDQSEMPVEEKADSYQYVDCTSYTQWVYFYLDGNTTFTAGYRQTDGIPAGWTFAMHRYDCRTNGGSAFETSFTSLEDLEAAIASGSYTLPEAGAFTADVTDSIIIDMSHMMEGHIGKAESSVNKTLGRWLDVNTSQMPPVYTSSGRVYLIRLSDGSMAAVRFTAFSNPYQYDTKGYISFDYRYPLTPAK